MFEAICEIMKHVAEYFKDKEAGFLQIFKDTKRHSTPGYRLMSSLLVRFSPVVTSFIGTHNAVLIYGHCTTSPELSV